jgi:hypothetical protein
MELRCENRLHGRLSEVDGQAAVEIVCRSSFCKGPEGAVVLHFFSVATGELIATKRYRNPLQGKETHGLGQRTAVRHA